MRCFAHELRMHVANLNARPICLGMFTRPIHKSLAMCAHRFIHLISISTVIQCHSYFPNQIAMSYGRAQLHDSEDELPESDDELIMSVLLDLGIQERPDIDNRNTKELEITTSTRSSYTVVDESSPRRFSVAFLEKPDGCTVVGHFLLLFTEWTASFVLYIPSYLPARTHWFYVFPERYPPRCCPIELSLL